MASGGFIDKALDHIPGYGGYRDKERRRDSDRVIRDSLVLGYTQQANRMQALATQLADERKIMLIGLVDKPLTRLIGLVDKPLTRLHTFIDRVNTASYGYAPLFQDAAVDDAALDQMAAFDQALADQQDELASQIGELEAADPASDDFKRIAGEIGKTVDGLGLRFDKRNEVIHGGKALVDANVLALLDKPGATEQPAAYRMHQNEAVSHASVNYTVLGRITVNSTDGAWRLFQLAGGDNNQWLHAPSVATDSYYWLRRSEAAGAPGAQTVTVSGSTATYTLAGSGKGTAEVIGRQGASGDRPVALEHYHYSVAGLATDGELHVYVLGAETLALLGTRIDVADLEIYSREQ
jgi:hypothetical protein